MKGKGNTYCRILDHKQVWCVENGKLVHHSLSFLSFFARESNAIDLYLCLPFYLLHKFSLENTAIKNAWIKY